MTARAGLVPVSAWNARAKLRGLMQARAASIFHRQPLPQVAAHVIEQRREAPVGPLQLEQRGELRLSARPAVVHHQLLCHLARDRLAEVLGDQRQRQIDARGDAGRAPELAALHEDAVGLEPDARKPRAKSAQRVQCVVAGRPSSSPVAASR